MNFVYYTLLIAASITVDLHASSACSAKIPVNASKKNLLDVEKVRVLITNEAGAKISEATFSKSEKKKLTLCFDGSEKNKINVYWGTKGFPTSYEVTAEKGVHGIKLVIDSKEKTVEIKPNKPKRSAKSKSTGATTAAGTSASTAVTGDFLKNSTAANLPAHIDLKILLTSLTATGYEGAVRRLLNATNHEQALTTLMKKNVDNTLLETPLVKKKLELLSTRPGPVGPESLRKKIKEMQPEYVQVYPSLKSATEKVDAAVESTLTSLRDRLKAELL